MRCPSETRLQAFVDGDLEADEIATLSVHLDTCTECRTLIGVVQPVPLDDDTTAERVGRYVLRRVLGKGGMGVVYEAVDPELHRVVALKVLRSDLGASPKRLLGEAEAMAKLAHPNVVAIYDVGRSAERVFIVMALVDGLSLRHWLASERRSLDAILDAFLQAADGLRAAHAAGLVHRDFKPENVFVASDGRVLVGDFGLAAVDGVAAAGEGSVAYMAPEQKTGDKVDARADQFSFCTSLREATAGRAPRWLAKVLTRGTADDPAARWASMTALATALRSGRRRARLAPAVLATLGVGAAIAVALAYPRDSRDSPLCKGGAAEVDQAWSDAPARRVEEAFALTKSPLAEPTWKRSAIVLRDYADAWRGALRHTCEAPRPRDAAGARVVDQQLSCLSDRLDTLRAVASSLEHADAPMLEQVPAMLALLPHVDDCEDVRQIASMPAPPPPAKRASVDAAKKKLSDASVSLAAGRYDEALARANDAVAVANGAGWLPVEAEAYLGVGTAHGRLGHVTESEQALEHAASSASAGQAPATAVRAWIQLMHFIGFEAKRYEDGARYSEYAKASLASMPGAEELEIERLAWSRAMLVDQRRYTEALVVSREELALAERHAGPEHHAFAVANDGLAGVLVGQCKSRDAIAPQEKCCDVLEKEYGTPHPQLALCLGNLAALYANLGDHPHAIEIKARALSMFEQITGHPNHVAMAHRNMARSLLEVGRLDDAAKEIDSAAAGSQRESDQLSVLLLEGDLARRRGDLEGSRTKLETATQRVASAPPGRRFEPLASLAETNLRLERFADAARLAHEAATAASAAYGAGSCRTAEPLRLEAESLLASRRRTDALPLAAAAVGALSDAQLDPRLRARADETLSKVRGP